MNADRWSRIRRLHAEALELPLEQRRAFIEAACGDDKPLFDELWSLVSADREDAFLEALVVEQVAAGVVLGDFELLEELGSGGTGIVFRARQISLEREVAVKVMPRHFALNATRVARFKREAKAAAKLKHPNIAPVFEVGEEGDVHYFAMELVDGHDLAKELELQREGASNCLHTGPAEGWMDAARLAHAVAEALAFAHKSGVVHRDVKPHNILLDRQCRPRLVDFGLAKDESLGSITVTDKVEGTPYYMSPEQARSVDRRIDGRTDIYSLGVVLYELLTRSRPFEGRTSQEVLHKIIRREPRPVRQLAPGVPRDLAVICAKAMEKRPEDRYATAQDLACDLRHFLAGEPIEARPPGLVRKSGRLLARRPVPFAAAAAVALTLGVASFSKGIVERGHWPELELEVLFADPSLDLGTTPVHATAYPLDSFAGTATGDPVELGSSPFASFRLPPGTWCVEVTADGIGWAQLIRRIEADHQPPALRARIHRDDELPEQLVAIEGHELPLSAFGSPLLSGRPGGGSLLGRNGVVNIRSYGIEPTEGSFGDYLRYLDESGDPLPALWSEIDVTSIDERLPAVLISLDEARRYAEWEGLRLPFEPELELAARGPEWARYPWGDSKPTEPERANVRSHAQSDLVGLAGELERFLLNAEPVDSRPEASTPTGLQHMLGNVEEFTESTGRSANSGTAGPIHFLHGGSWSWGFVYDGFPAVGGASFEAALAMERRGLRCVRGARFGAPD